MQPSSLTARISASILAFIRMEAAGGLLLMACAALALVWANSPFAASYAELWGAYLTVGLEDAAISKPLILWINDGLMALFFFLVGLEIKREVLTGELRQPRQAALALAGAVGGMAVPALFYLVVTSGTDAAAGWGIPMATDIAFALGVLALLGSRAPVALKIFLTALAIVDDLGAVLVIALFYTAELSVASLLVGFGALAVLALLSRLGVRRVAVFVVLGLVVWVAFLKSGVHATIAGVLVALTVPIDAEGEADYHDSLLHRMEHALHGYIAFLVLPVFALANAGVALGGGADLGSAVSLGILLGLMVGKPIGVMLCAWLAIKVGLASLPTGVTWRQMLGVSLLTGVGFTMSLFIAGLAFDSALLLDSAKLGILVASTLMGVGGYVLLRTSAAKNF